VAAKTWAFVTGARLAGVETFHAVVESLPASAGSAWVIDDALREEIFVQEFRTSAARWVPIAPVAIRPLDDWLHGVAPGDIVCGPGVGKWSAEIAATDAAVAETAFQRPTAAGIARCGLRLAVEGRLADPFGLVPLYVRRSAAEEKLDLMMEGKRS
jgi:tRNA A37 threonylcarbamoyladenosine modification protein TsaB